MRKNLIILSCLALRAVGAGAQSGTLEPGTTAFSQSSRETVPLERAKQLPNAQSQPVISPNAFRIIIVPDTQYLPTNVFTEEMRWIETNRTTSPPIVAMLHMGDVVDAPTVEQWGAKDPGIAVLTNVPFLICPGNHDYDPPIADRNLATFNAYIPRSLYTRKPWWHGGFYANTNSENAYLTLTNAPVKLLLFELEFGPRTNVLLWVSNTAAAYPDHLVAIATHNYLMPSGSRNTTNDAYNPHVTYGVADATDGEEMWHVVKTIPNLRFIWCGHQIEQPPVAHSIAVGTHGNWVAQVLCDWQEQRGIPELMVFTFFAAAGEVLAESYNPATGAYLRNPQYEFTLPMNGSGKLPEPVAAQPAATHTTAITNILDTPPFNAPFPNDTGTTN
jgi:hypothetical protein